MNVKFRKKVLCKLDMCYAVSSISLGYETGVLFASENKGCCYCFTGNKFECCDVVWKQPGGTMSMVPLPGKHAQFWAIQKFYPVFQSENTEIVYLKYTEKGWVQQRVMKLPYCHRFDFLSGGETNYFLGATLCTSKKNQDDWSDPGKLYVGIVEKNGSSIKHISVLKDGLTKNHGYCKIIKNGDENGLVASEEGVFLVKPPKKLEAKWNISKIIDKPTSDVAAIDLDGDGHMEIATIEPFHGNKLCIYKEFNQTYQKVYESPRQREFYHALKGGKLCGLPVFVVGCRSGQRELFYISTKDSCKTIEEHTIDVGGGPANIEIIHYGNRDVIAVANHHISQAVIYEVVDCTKKNQL